MEATIELLCEKNIHLEKFFRANESQLRNIESGDFKALDSFYKTREGILDIIRKIDELIEKSNDIPKSEAAVDPEIRRQIIVCLQHKNNLVTKILEQDLRILSAIETAKSRVIKDLAQVRGARKAIGAYKSGKPKKRLDEEA
jgi:hypothetical protein